MLSFLHRIGNFNKFLFHYKQGSNPLTTHLRFISKTQREKPSNKHHSSLTFSYLINSCGLSPQSALSSSQKIQLKSTENADSVLNFFKSHGFTNTQITKLITKSPTLLQSSVDNTLKPKFDYFANVGLTPTEFASLACSDPILFRSSLQNRLKPNFELLSSMVGNTKKLLVVFRRSSRLFSNNLETNFLPNVRILRSYGVSTPKIAKLIILYPRVLTNETEQFAVSVESVKKLGFNPLTFLFIQGVYVVSATSPLTWERKLGVYKSLGWSEGQTISAFTKQPFCLLLSEKKISKMIDFYVKKLHWEPCFLAANPKFLGYSLEKRVLPRFLVLSFLSSKSLIRRYPRLNHRDFSITESEFYNKYVVNYMYQVPEVIEVYKGNLEPMEFEGGPSFVQGL